MAAAATTKPKWRKILYAPQPYEDNYVADTFLEQMRTNANVREHDYGGMVRSAAAITQQICAVLIFFSVFEFVRQDAISAALLGGIDVFLAVAGFAVLRIHLGLPLHALDTLSSCLLFCATLSLLSPVLRTLTRSYADDTIWALATFLGLLHLITHDYNYVNSGIGRFSGTISLNAAIFTAVLLGSRLQSNEHVFAFVLLAIEIFAMFPIFQREVKVRMASGCHCRCWLQLRGGLTLRLRLHAHTCTAMLGAAAPHDSGCTLRTLVGADLAALGAAEHARGRLRALPGARVPALVHARARIQERDSGPLGHRPHPARAVSDDGGGGARSKRRPCHGGQAAISGPAATAGLAKTKLHERHHSFAANGHAPWHAVSFAAFSFERI